MKNKFNTFGGVFTPSILTILGVIMFMRANFVVAQAGVLGALAILLVAKSITFTTSLSISAISTNMTMRGGGSYFLISRVLGAEYGGAIGLALFMALALSVPFYILGFTEALVLSLPSLAPHFQKITFLTAAVLFFIAFSGAGWAIRFQYIIMTFLFLAIFSFLGGALSHFSIETLQENLPALYSVKNPESSIPTYFTFWTVFAIYFPAVTGIDAGLNMSGDLRDPSKSIPTGTLAAVLLGFLVYACQIILDGGAYGREELRNMPFEILKNNSLFDTPFFVIAGVVAATLSSALGSYLGAPRVLQAVSRDKMLPFLKFFSKGSVKGDEPRRGLLLTCFFTYTVLLWAGNSSGGTSLNAVAAIISMFFLYSYGMINLAAFIEDFSDNPSFRPHFKYFHWSIALLGALGCFSAAILINWFAAIAAIFIIISILWFIRVRHLKSTFGDARRGFLFSSIRKNLLRLSKLTEGPKNWRPTVLVFTGNPDFRREFIIFSTWLEAERGMVYLANILVGNVNELALRRPAAINKIEQFCLKNDINAFPVVVAADSMNQGIASVLQTGQIGPIMPNFAILGWSENKESLNNYITQLQTAAALDINIVLLHTEKLPDPKKDKRIDIWWRGQKNGNLMLLLSYLLTHNWEWHAAKIRILRQVGNSAGEQPAKEALDKLIYAARVEAQSEIIVSESPFAEVLQIHSYDADCIFLGFEIPSGENFGKWQKMYSKMMEGMPTTILVHARNGQTLLEESS